MGLSGLLAGGTLLAICALLSGLFATFSPMWLITRVELHNHLCWTGSGLWISNFVWGDDIPEMGLVCSGDSFNNFEKFCKSNDRSAFEKSMCSPTNASKVFMVSAQILGVFTILVAHLFGSMRFKRQHHDYLEELRLAKVLLGITILTFICALLGFTVIYQSDLFSAEHAREISKDKAVPFTSSQFGCAFQSPLRASNLIQSLIKSSPLNCLYGGPSFAMAAASFVLWALAIILFAILCKDVERLQKAVNVDSSFHGTTPKPSIRHPLITAVLYPRHYSLYGAISRHYSFSKYRKTILMIIPILTMATAAVFAIMMLMNGAAVQVFIRISSPAFSKNEWMKVLEHYPAHQITFLEEIKDADKPQGVLVEIIEEVFDFTMLTSIKNFWDGKAYALAILTAVFCAIWPYVRVAVQLLLYFIPFPEQHRGRTLTWLDALGKWTMVNTFVLCFMGVAFHLQSTIRLKGLMPFSKDLLDVGIEVSLGPRIATYLFVVNVLISILISEAYVYAHRKARDWEEQRNEQTYTRPANANGAGQEPIDRLRAFASSVDFTPPNFQPPSPDTAVLLENANPNALARPTKVSYEHGYGYEALCERHHNPVPGKKYVYSTLAKVLVWMAIGFTACTTLAGMLEVSMAFTFGGVVGDVIVAANDRRREYSLMSIGTSIQTDMGSLPAGGVALTGVFFAVAFVAPILRLIGVTVLWFVPMRPYQQKSWFHLMEIIESWSALDVYFVSTLAATLEIGKLSKVILGGSFPAVEALVDEKFPQFGGLFVVKEELLNGMFLILVGILFEKFLSLFIVAQTATAVAERIAEEKLAVLRNRGLPGIREENDMFRELEEHPETWAILSPAARYTSASTKSVYSGLPRFVWTIGIRLGLMEEVEVTDEQQQGEATYFSLEGV